MYSQDDMNMQKAYIQINEMFNDEQHLKQLGYKLASPFSDRAKAHLRKINYANTWISDMRNDAINDGEDFNNLDPEWMSAWMSDVFNFDPADYGIVYKPGSNKSDYIRYALAAKSNADRRNALRAKRAEKTSPVAEKFPVTKPKVSKPEVTDPEATTSTTSSTSVFEDEEDNTFKFGKRKNTATTPPATDSDRSIEDELEAIQKRREELEKLKREQNK